MKRSPIKAKKPINKYSKKRKKKLNELKGHTSKRCECFICGTVGNHAYHHIFTGPNKYISDMYLKYVYPCWRCHTMCDDNIHENQEFMDQLKRQAQLEIMEEHNISLEEWLSRHKQSWI